MTGKSGVWVMPTLFWRALPRSHGLSLRDFCRTVLNGKYLHSDFQNPTVPSRPQSGNNFRIGKHWAISLPFRCGLYVFLDPVARPRVRFFFHIALKSSPLNISKSIPGLSGRLAMYCADFSVICLKPYFECSSSPAS